MFPSPEQGPSPEKLHLLYILPQVQRRLLAHREHLAGLQQSLADLLVANI